MNNTTLEAFSSVLNTDRLVNLCVSSLNIDPTEEFLSILEGIGMSVFKAESKEKTLNEVNSIVVREVSKYVLDKRRDLLFKVISPKLYQQEIFFSTEMETKLEEFKDITSIFLDSVDILYSSNGPVNTRNNVISFKERLSPGKDLWSEIITVVIEPGNYSPEEYLEELEDLMARASKIKNFYNFFYDKTIDKISIFSTSEKFEGNTRRSIRNCEKAGDFILIPESSTVASTLGFSKNTFEEPDNVFIGKSRFKYVKNSFFNVEICCGKSGKILFNFQVPVDCYTLPVSLKCEGLEDVKTVVVKVFPEDTELAITGRIEYVVQS